MFIEPQAGMKAIAYTAGGVHIVSIIKVEGTRVVWTSDTYNNSVNWSIWEWGGNLVPIPEGATDEQIQALMSIIDEPRARD